MASPTPPSADSQLAILTSRLAAVAAASDHSAKTLQSSARKFDACVDQHVGTALPAVTDLASAARYFWAGMLDDDDDDINAEPGEDDIVAALRAVEKSLVAFGDGASRTLRDLAEGLVGSEEEVRHMRRVSLAAAVIDAKEGHAAARALWAEIDGTTIPAARAELRRNIEAIARNEKLQSELVKSADAAYAEHIASQEAAAAAADSGDGVALRFKNLGISPQDDGVTPFQRVVDMTTPLRAGRENMAQWFERHQQLSAQAERLTCQATTAKMLRDELHVHVLATGLVAEREKTVREALVRAAAVASGPLLDLVRERIAALEWTDIRGDGDDFPAEALLALSAALLAHLVRYCGEDKRGEVDAVLRAIKGGSSSSRPLPASVTDALRVVEGSQTEPLSPLRSRSTFGSQKPVAEGEKPPPYEYPTVGDDDDDEPPAKLVVIHSREEAEIEDDGPVAKTTLSSSSTFVAATTDIDDRLPLRRDPSGLSMVDPMPLDEAPSPPPPPQLQILGATWGGRDATAQLQRLVKDNRLVLDMRAMHESLGDPLPYKYKNLTALYRYGTDSAAYPPRLFILCEQQPIFASGVFVIKPDDPNDRVQNHPASRVSAPVGDGWRVRDGTFEVLAATYGPKRIRHPGALAGIEDRLAGRRRRLVPDNGFFGGDTWPNQFKTWTVFVRYPGDANGAVRTITGLEGEEMVVPWAS